MSTAFAKTNVLHFPEQTRVDPTPRFEEPAQVIILPVMYRKRIYDERKLPVVIGAPPWKR